MARAGPIPRQRRLDDVLEQVAPDRHRGRRGAGKRRSVEAEAGAVGIGGDRTASPNSARRAARRAAPPSGERQRPRRRRSRSEKRGRSASGRADEAAGLARSRAAGGRDRRRGAPPACRTAPTASAAAARPAAACRCHGPASRAAACRCRGPASRAAACRCRGPASRAAVGFDPSRGSALAAGPPRAARWWSVGRRPGPARSSADWTGGAHDHRPAALGANRRRPSGGRGVLARGRSGGNGVVGAGVASGSTTGTAERAAGAAEAAAIRAAPPTTSRGVSGVLRGGAVRGVCCRSRGVRSSRGARPTIGAGVAGAANASRSARASGPRRITFERSIVRLRGRRGGLTTPSRAPRSLAPTGTFISASAWRIAFPNALASGNRWLGSAASARSSNPSIAGGRSGLSVRTEGTTPEATWLKPATSLVISRRRRPVSSSNSTAPSEKMSVRRSTPTCVACSGDMYERFPLRLPTTERSWRRLASPKSDSFTSPANEMSTFDGVTSR